VLDSFKGDVNTAILSYIKNPAKNPLSDDERHLILSVPELGRRASFHTRELALHVIESNRGNLICPYHKEKDKGGHIHDSTTTKQSRYQVTGTPYDRVINVRKDPTCIRRKGILDCGCAEDDVLLDFYWWKTLTVTSASSKIKEGWRSQRLDPRARLFMKGALKLAKSKIAQAKLKKSEVATTSKV
jgi:hypothetical protein